MRRGETVARFVRARVLLHRAHSSIHPSIHPSSGDRFTTQERT